MNAHNEQQARQLLALGLDEFGHHTEAANVRKGIDLDDYKADLWAIRAALDTQPAAAQEAVAWRDDVGNLYPSKESVDKYLPLGRTVHALYAAPIAAPATAAPADLIERCKEILAWQGTGMLTGDSLRAFADSRWPNDDDSLRRAESETAAEAFRFVATLPAASTPAAPGIDLREIGEAMAQAEQHVETLHSLCSRPSVLACIKRLRKAQASLIGASPKGDAAKFDLTANISIPRDLIGAACSAISKKRNASTLLAKLRRYTVGDLSITAQDSPKGDVHPDDLAVDAFAAAMKAKLAEARAKGRGGWNGDEPGMQQRLSDMLRAHVEKGDPRDVANFCMFLHQRGEAISPEGGSEVRDAARYRWLKSERLLLWRDKSTGAPTSCSFDFDEQGHDVDAAITTALRAAPKWQPIETAPEGRLVVVGWLDEEGQERQEFDYVEDGMWIHHADLVEHAQMVAPPGSQMPKEQPPYQWWMDLPAFPAARPQGVNHGS